MEGSGYKLGGSGKGDIVDSVAAMVKEEFCEKMVEIRRMSDRVMAVVLVFERDVLRLIVWYSPKVEEVWKINRLFMIC